MAILYVYIRTYEYSDNIGEIDADFAFKNCYLLCILSCVCPALCLRL